MSDHIYRLRVRQESSIRRKGERSLVSCFFSQSNTHTRDEARHLDFLCSAEHFLDSNCGRWLQCRQLLESTVEKSHERFCFLLHIHRRSSSVDPYLCVCVLVFGIQTFKRLFLFWCIKHKYYTGHHQLAQRPLLLVCLHLAHQSLRSLFPLWQSRSLPCPQVRAPPECPLLCIAAR
jgi:hypothetical protein